MIYFICWVVFLVVLILSVAVTYVMDNRGNRSARSRAAADQPSLEEDVAVDDAAEFVDDADAVESFGDFPAEGFPDAGEQPADDFAAFEEEFK